MSNYFEEYAQMSKIKLVSMIVDLQTEKGISDYWNDLMEGHSTKFLIQGRTMEEYISVLNGNKLHPSLTGQIKISPNYYLVDDCSIFSQFSLSPNVKTRGIKIFALKRGVDVIDRCIDLDEFEDTTWNADSFLRIKDDRDRIYGRSTF